MFHVQTKVEAWTPVDRRKVAELLKDGLSASQIGAIFKKSRNSIIGLVSRDDDLRQIGFARSPIGRGVPRTRKTRPVRIPSPARARPRKKESSVEDAPKPVAYRPASSGPHMAGLPLVSLERGMCRWPVNDAAPGELHLFCGAGTEGASYCACHSAIGSNGYAAVEV